MAKMIFDPFLYFTVIVKLYLQRCMAKIEKEFVIS